MHRLIFLVFSFLLVAAPIHAATYAQVFQSLLTQQRATGAVLSGGKVYFYSPGTTDLATVYTSRTMATVAANPATLSADGTVAVYGNGTYDIKITTAALVQKFYFYGITAVDALPAATAPPTLDPRIANIYDASNYVSFTTAVATIGSTRATLRYGSDVSLSADLTIPATLQLEPYNGAIITVASGKTLTLTGVSVQFPDNAQVFAGSGTVTGLREARPEWWGTGGADDAAVITKAITASRVIVLSSKTYIVSSVTVPSNTIIKTTGFSTILQQKSGSADSTRMLKIDGSNVIIESLTVAGNIATDTGEQYHAVFINSTIAPIDNVTIADIMGSDIRGDVLMIGGTVSFPVTNVRVGHVHGNNILRNVVSITGGEAIRIESVTAGARNGLYVLDIEPDAPNQPPKNIWIGYVRGSVVGIVGVNSSVLSSGITIDKMDLDPAYCANSIPAYSWYDVKTGFLLRNARDIRIGSFTAKNFTHHAATYVYNVGESLGTGIVFDYINITNCSTTDTTYNTSFNFAAVLDCRINAGNFTLSADSKSLIKGASSGADKTQLTLSNLTGNGTVAAYANNSEFSNIIVNTSSTYEIYINVNDSKIENNKINSPKFMGYSLRNVIANSNVTASTSLFTSGTGYDEHNIVNSTLNTVYYKNGQTLRAYSSAINFGGYYVWVDAAGKLRIKSSVPTSDLDGTVVGTQT